MEGVLHAIALKPQQPSQRADRQRPFGQGQPYSPGQIGRLLAATMFRVEQRDSALYVPPSRLRLILRTARLWERVGRGVLPGFAGVTITEASKDMYGVIPLKPVPARRMILVEAA